MSDQKFGRDQKFGQTSKIMDTWYETTNKNKNKNIITLKLPILSKYILEMMEQVVHGKNKYYTLEQG